MAMVSPALAAPGCKTAVIDDTTGDPRRCNETVKALWMCEAHYKRAYRAAAAYVKARRQKSTRPTRRYLIQAWLDNHRTLKPGGVLPFAPVEAVREYERQPTILAAVPAALPPAA